MIAEMAGNAGILTLRKVAFLCSNKIPAGAVLRCYDWAIAQRESGVCVISGFHSILERDVLRYLLKGVQPIIVALARGMKQRIEPELARPLAEGRLLIITPFDRTVTRASARTAHIRNQLMTELADSITIGYASPGGKVEAVTKGKKCLVL